MEKIFLALKLTAAVFAALASLGGAVGVIFGAYKWYLRQNERDSDVGRMKEENTLIVFALCACLDGLEQLGANHTVSLAKEKLDKYVNKMAHQ